MATTTPNLALIKPGGDDPYDVEDNNDNMDAVDSAITAVNDRLRHGASTFNSSTGVTITHNLGAATYKVSITPTSNPSGYLGEIWVAKSADSMVVYCSGSTTTTTFDWAIFS